MTKVQNLRKKLLAALLIAAVALAFSPLAATTAHAASASKFTIYKGQKIPVEFYAGNKVTFKSSKAKVVKIKKGKSNTFTIIAKKAGKAKLTASAKNYKTKRYVVTVKGSYPTGSIKKPVALGGSWKAIKSKDGKKQINMKTTILTGEAARAQILAIEGDPADGTAYFDRYYWLDAAVSANRTLYLIQVDYNTIKGFPPGNGAYLSGLGGVTYYDKNWKALSSATDYDRYYLSNVNGSVSDAPNGSTGSYYTAIFLNNSIKELRARDVSGIYDYQEIGSFGRNFDLIVSGCVSQKLP